MRGSSEIFSGASFKPVVPTWSSCIGHCRIIKKAAAMLSLGQSLGNDPRIGQSGAIFTLSASLLDLVYLLILQKLKFYRI